jgi:hypothetical protein
MREYLSLLTKLECYSNKKNLYISVYTCGVHHVYVIHTCCAPGVCVTGVQLRYIDRGPTCTRHYICSVAVYLYPHCDAHSFC